MNTDTTQARVAGTLDPFVLLKAIHDYHEAEVQRNIQYRRTT